MSDRGEQSIACSWLMLSSNCLAPGGQNTFRTLALHTGLTMQHALSLQQQVKDN